MNFANCTKDGEDRLNGRSCDGAGGGGDGADVDSERRMKPQRQRSPLDQRRRTSLDTLNSN